MMVMNKRCRRGRSTDTFPRGCGSFLSMALLTIEIGIIVCLLPTTVVSSSAASSPLWTSTTIKAGPKSPPLSPSVSPKDPTSPSTTIQQSPPVAASTIDPIPPPNNTIQPSSPQSPPPPPQQQQQQPLVDRDRTISFPRLKRRSRFTFQGPIITLTLKDPFANGHTIGNSSIRRTAARYREAQESTSSSTLSPPSSFGFDESETGNGNGQQQQTLSSDSEIAPPPPVDNGNNNNKKRRSSFLNDFWSSRQKNSNGDYDLYDYCTNFLNLRSLSPTILYSIKSTTKPLPNYVPSLQATSITTGYQYDGSSGSSSSKNSSSSSSSSSTSSHPKTTPTFIEGQLKFRKKFFGRFGGRKIGFPGAIEVDIGPSYLVKEKKLGLVLKIGGDDGGGSGSGITVANSVDDRTAAGDANTNNGGRYGCYGLVRVAMKRGRMYLEYARGSYRMNLPFHAVGSISVTPSYDFEKEEPACNIIGKSSSGRTAAVIDLNWDHPTLSVAHALDQRNTISPEISLYDAKIIYNWNVALDSGAIKTRLDPSTALQVTWIDQTFNGKWVTDFKLPLVGNPGPLAGDIRVRRQFVF